MQGQKLENRQLVINYLSVTTIYSLGGMTPSGRVFALVHTQKRSNEALAKEKGKEVVGTDQGLDSPKGASSQK